MAKILKIIKDFLLRPYHRYQKKKQFEKRIEELRKRDPFIYK